MGAQLDEFKTLFIEEGEQNMAVLQKSLAALRGAATAPDAVLAQRAAHTIRGMSASMGYDGIRDLSKGIEGLFVTWGKGGKLPPPDALAIVEETSAALSAMFAAVKAGAPVPPPPDGLLARLLGAHLPL